MQSDNEVCESGVAQAFLPAGFIDVEPAGGRAYRIVFEQWRNYRSR
jgi:hypothetical protein